ncbi:MAG TPA: PHB depolymerase family esterase [Oculatellaceae cyanobacterium]
MHRQPAIGSSTKLFVILALSSICLTAKPVLSKDIYRTPPNPAAQEGPLESDALQSGDFWEAVHIDGINRNFIVHVPSGISKVEKSIEKPPVVLVFHGGGGGAKSMAKFSRFNEIGDAHNALVVYPDAISKHWNDGRNFRAHPSEDDVQFITKALDFLIERYNADPKRIYVAGISNGGFFAERLALQLPTRIAAIAVIDAGITKQLEAMASIDVPVATLLILGTEDPLVPFKGGAVAPMFGGRGEVLPGPETVSFWANHNHCLPQGETKDLPVRDETDVTRIKQTVFQPKENGKMVMADLVEGGGHTWPSGSQYMPRRFIGRTTKQLNNEDIWQFFQDKHTP